MMTFFFTMDRGGFVMTRLSGVCRGAYILAAYRNRFLPYAGYVTILLNDFPMAKYAVLGLLGLSLFFERE